MWFGGAVLKKARGHAISPFWTGMTLHTIIQIFFSFHSFIGSAKHTAEKETQLISETSTTQARRPLGCQLSKVKREVERAEGLVDGVLSEGFLQKNLRNVMYAAFKKSMDYWSHFMQLNPDGPLSVLRLLFMYTAWKRGFHCNEQCNC